MKLNFASLAKQVHNEEEEHPTISFSSSTKHQESSSTNHLNYYRKSIVEQKALTTFAPKPKKSQLNHHDQNHQLLLGTSILQSYFSAKPVTLTQRQPQPKVNLSVMYPYQVSASLTPSKIDQQIHSMKTKGILNESALKFVRKQIHKNLSKSKQKKEKQLKEKLLKQEFNKEKLNNSLGQVHQSIFLDTSIQVDSQQNLTDVLDITDKQFQSIEQPSILGTTVSSKLFKYFLKDSTQKIIDQPSSQFLQKTTQSTKQILTPVGKWKKPSSNNHKQQGTPHYMNPINRQEQYNSLNSNKKQLIPTHTLKLQQALKQVRSKPSLELTKSSPFTQKVIEQRQSQYSSKKTNVFDSLYKQAYKRQCMNELKKESKQKEIDENINKKKTLETKIAKKYKVEESFMERLEKSIQRKYFKEYLIQKYEVNPKTGQPFYKPDTNSSKKTYEELFHKSLEKLSSGQIDQMPLNSKQSKDEHNSTKKSKKQSEIAMSTWQQSHTLKSGKHTKQSSKHKHSQLDRLNRSMEIMTNNSRELTESRSRAIVDKRDDQVIERIVRLFYPFMNSGSSSSLSSGDKDKHQEKGVVNEQLGFQKTYEALFQLSEKEYIILSPLFEQVQLLQKSSKITSLIFTNILTQFYKKLNHYDKVILRKKIQTKHKQNRQSNKRNNNSGSKSSRVFEKSVESKSTLQKEKIFEESTPNYKPKINELSASMEKLNPKYEAQLYYV